MTLALAVLCGAWVAAVLGSLSYVLSLIVAIASRYVN